MNGPLNVSMGVSDKVPKLYVDIQKGEISISYPKGKGFGICNIEATLRSPSELAIVKCLKTSGYYLVGRTEKDGAIPDYVKDAFDLKKSELIFVEGTKYSKYIYPSNHIKYLIFDLIS